MKGKVVLVRFPFDDLSTSTASIPWPSSVARGVEAQCVEHSSANLVPAVAGEAADPRAEITERHGANPLWLEHGVDVQALFRREPNLPREPTHLGRERDDRNLTGRAQDRVIPHDQYRTSLVRRRESVPADVPPLQ